MGSFPIVDMLIVGLYLVASLSAGIYVRRYVRKVDHFLLAGREMNLYLGVASLVATEFGIVTCIYTAQNGYDKGFAGATPGILAALAMFIIGWSGFCIKPLRNAGVTTIPELFEKRFGSRIRWMCGVVMFLGGLLNMGVFLRTGGEFLVGVTGLGDGKLELSMTVLPLCVVIYTILGGMLSVLVTDFIQFVVMSVGLLAITILILSRVGWSALTAAVEREHGAGGFNPFLHPEMGWQYVLFNGLVVTAGMITWQPVIQRVLATRDTTIGQRMYRTTSFFYVCRFLLPGLWGVAALTILTPDQIVGSTTGAMPLFLTTILPTGLLGLLIAAMLAAEMSTDSSYMLTWGSIMYNDILAPFRRKRPWTERCGMFVNRTIIALIGLFLLIFGLWYEIEGDLWTYLAITGTIYISSIATLLIACCYWPAANNWGASAAIVIGAVVPIGFLVMEKLPATRELAKAIGPYYSGIATYTLTAVAMVVGSLLKPAAI